LTDTHDALGEVFRREHGLVVASLAKTFGDVDLAEEALAEAVTVALETWTPATVPRKPAAWLHTVARRRAIDRLRRRRVLHEKLALLAEPSATGDDITEDQVIPDERLRLIFACCHPALSTEARVALTLRSLGGLTTAEVARAFLTSEPTMFQRITRARSKIRLAGIPIEMPAPEDLPGRLRAVLAVIYLVFNEGYSPMGGNRLTRVDLCHEAILLAEMMTELMPDEPEARSLAALLWLTDARRPGRLDAKANLVLLEDQDRSSWDRMAIDRGLSQLARASASPVGPYRLQAEIGAVHAASASAADTDWDRIIGLYRQLVELTPSPVVALNLGAAVAMRDGPEAGLAVVDGLAEPLATYQPFHAARAELLLRAGRHAEAVESFDRALASRVNEVERRHLEARRQAAAEPGGPSA
jgi:RNA polymerase sigma-70 factor (ECF subfamily)